jgi:glycosyltransferase involved in cell wall biosynthesis
VTPETGILVPPGDERVLAEAIIQLLRDAARARAIGAAARQRVEAHFSLEAMVEGTLAVYREVLAAQMAMSARTGPM